MTTTTTEYLTPEQAAELLPIGNADWVRQQLRTGRLSGSKVQGRWVTTREAIAAMVEAGSNSQRRRRTRLRAYRRRPVAKGTRHATE